MIVFNILANDPLKKELNQKLSLNFLRLSEIPVYDIAENIENFTKYVKTGNTSKIKEIIFKKLDKEMREYKKEMLEYLKKYIHKDEAFDIGLTLYYYDNKTDEYGYVQKKVMSPSQKPMKIDKNFFKLLKGKLQDRHRFIELTLSDLMITAYSIIKSDRLELISQNEWEKELMQGEKR